MPTAHLEPASASLLGSMPGRGPVERVGWLTGPTFSVRIRDLL